MKGKASCKNVTEVIELGKLSSEVNEFLFDVSPFFMTQLAKTFVREQWNMYITCS